MMRLTPISLKDVPILFTIRVQTRENALSLAQLEQLGITPASVARILGESHQGWLCWHDDIPVGFAMGNRENGEMWVIALLPEYEGYGYGRALLNEVENWLFAEGCHTLWLTTDVDPALRAYGFYRAQGWQDDKIEDGLRYMKKKKAAA